MFPVELMFMLLHYLAISWQLLVNCLAISSVQISAIIKFQNILLYLDFGYLLHTSPLLA